MRDDRQRLQQIEDALDFPRDRKGEVADLAAIVDAGPGTGVVVEESNVPVGRFGCGRRVTCQMKYDLVDGALLGRRFHLSLVALTLEQALAVAKAYREVCLRINEKDTHDLAPLPTRDPS